MLLIHRPGQAEIQLIFIRIGLKRMFSASHPNRLELAPMGSNTCFLAPDGNRAQTATLPQPKAFCSESACPPSPPHSANLFVRPQDFGYPGTAMHRQRERATDIHLHAYQINPTMPKVE